LAIALFLTINLKCDRHSSNLWKSTDLENGITIITLRQSVIIEPLRLTTILFLMTCLSFDWDKQKNLTNQKKHGVSFQSKRVSTISRLVLMKPEYDLANMKSRPNPFAQQLKQQVTLPLRIDVINFFEKKAKEKGISYQELIDLYLQDCVTNDRELSF
jgi:hypothetical protein